MSKRSSSLLAAVYEDLHHYGRRRFYLRDPQGDTELIHEAYIRVSGVESWDNTGHFFGAMANAMRNANIDRIRKKNCCKNGGLYRQVDCQISELPSDSVPPEVGEVREALKRLSLEMPRVAEVVFLRFFESLTEIEVACRLAISRRTVCRDWSIGKAWLRAALSERCSKNVDFD